MTAAAIARKHKDAGFDVPVYHGVARLVLDEPIAGRCSRSDQGTAAGSGLLSLHKEDGIRAHCACGSRGAVAIAMIGVMRDATLRMREAAALTRGAR